MPRGLSDEEYQKILAANPDWQDITDEEQGFASSQAPAPTPAQPQGLRFYDKPDEEQYLGKDQKQAMKAKLYGYLADKMKRRGEVTSKPYYDKAEEAFAHQERVSDANALGGLLLNAGDRAGTVLGRGPASNFGQFSEALDNSRQQRINNMRALRGMEEQSNMNDLQVARYLTELERGDEARKDKRQALYEQMLAKRQQSGLAADRLKLDQQRQAEVERANKAREQILRDRPAGSGSYTPIATSEDGVMLINPKNPNDQQIVDLPKGFTPKSAKQDEKIDGKTRLKPGEMNRLNDARDAFKQMDFVDSMIPKLSSMMGPIQGRIGELNPYNTEAQKAQADLKVAAQIIGAYMEGGVLRKEDEIKYARMLPQLSDTPEVAKYKAKQVRKMLADRYNGDLKALESQNYSTEGFARPEERGSTPQAQPNAKAPEEMTDEERKAELDRLRKAVGQ